MSVYEKNTSWPLRPCRVYWRGSLVPIGSSRVLYLKLTRQSEIWSGGLEGPAHALSSDRTCMLRRDDAADDDSDGGDGDDEG